MGINLVVSGYGKLSHLFNTITFFAKYGFPIPDATAWFIGSLELFGGVALILGLFVCILGILYAIEFVVASVWVPVAHFRFRPRPASVHVDCQRVCAIRTLVPAHYLSIRAGSKDDDVSSFLQNEDSAPNSGRHFSVSDFWRLRGLPAARII
jgi:hypothetical protein